jgi:spore germination cell wall hydrolase CwlJ-like protein
MTITKKLLIAMITTVLLSFCFGATAFASTQDIKKIDTTEITGDTSGAMAVSGSAIDADIEEELGKNRVNNPSLSDSDIEALLLQEGYYLDAEGELCYIAPEKDATVIEEEDDSDKDAAEEEKDKEEDTVSAKDLRLLACLIYSEAGNQNYEGMLAVANVVLNRVKSDAYWHVNTVEQAIYDRKWSVQFGVTVKNSKTGTSMMDKALKLYDTRKFTGANPEAQKKALNKAIKAAKAALSGKNNIGNYLCFQNKYSAKSIKKRYSDYRIIDDHIFYRTK